MELAYDNEMPQSGKIFFNFLCIHFANNIKIEFTLKDNFTFVMVSLEYLIDNALP